MLSNLEQEYAKVDHLYLTDLFFQSVRNTKCQTHSSEEGEAPLGHREAMTPINA